MARDSETGSRDLWSVLIPAILECAGTNQAGLAMELRVTPAAVSNLVGRGRPAQADRITGIASWVESLQPGLQDVVLAVAGLLSHNRASDFESVLRRARGLLVEGLSASEEREGARQLVEEMRAIALDTSPQLVSQAVGEIATRFRELESLLYTPTAGAVRREVQTALARLSSAPRKDRLLAQQTSARGWRLLVRAEGETSSRDDFSRALVAAERSVTEVDRLAHISLGEVKLLRALAVPSKLLVKRIAAERQGAPPTVFAEMLDELADAEPELNTADPGEYPLDLAQLSGLKVHLLIAASGGSREGHKRALDVAERKLASADSFHSKYAESQPDLANLVRTMAWEVFGRVVLSDRPDDAELIGGLRAGMESANSGSFTGFVSRIDLLQLQRYLLEHPEAATDEFISSAARRLMDSAPTMRMLERIGRYVRAAVPALESYRPRDLA